MKHAEKMVKICQTGLQKLNFEIIHCQKFPQAMDEVKNFFFQILEPLGCQGWVVIPQIVKKSQNHCTLFTIQTTVFELREKSADIRWILVGRPVNIIFKGGTHILYI